MLNILITISITAIILTSISVMASLIFLLVSLNRAITRNNHFARLVVHSLSIIAQHVRAEAAKLQHQQLNPTVINEQIKIPTPPNLNKMTEEEKARFDQLNNELSRLALGRDSNEILL